MPLYIECETNIFSGSCLKLLRLLTGQFSIPLTYPLYPLITISPNVLRTGDLCLLARDFPVQWPSQVCECTVFT
jgi:hypothetical protein